MLEADSHSSIADLERHLAARTVTLKPPAKRTGAEAWFPYYAGYSPMFVREALLGLGVKPGWTVLDPWNGAGTTTAVADALGCDVIGCDINPVAGLVAAARLVRTDDATHSFGLASQLLSVADRMDVQVQKGDPLLAWLSPRLTRRYRCIENAIVDLLASKGGIRVDLALTTPPPFASFFMLCLLRAAKTFVRLRANSNPTWVTPEKRGDAHPDVLDCAFLTMVDACARDAETAATERHPPRATSSRIMLADARKLPQQDKLADAIITSPPYCTRVDYFHATLYELAGLGIGPNSERFRELRSKAMGTTLMRSDEIPVEHTMPQPIRNLLRKIKAHPSKASSSYYYRSFLQYFDDATQSLKEVCRVLKPGRTGVIVVQNSYYKNIPIPLGDLYVSIAKKLGLTSRVVHRMPVRRVLAKINPRATKHESERFYTEDVVALQRST